MNAGKTATITITPKTLLLIDHETNLREVVQACLRDLGGWNVLTADSFLEGLQQAIQYPPDAIMLEFSKAGVDEFKVLEQLRTQPITQTIPVVLLTARAKWLDSQLLQQYEVVGVISNSLDPASLPNQVANLLGWNWNY